MTRTLVRQIRVQVQVWPLSTDWKMCPGEPQRLHVIWTFKDLTPADPALPVSSTKALYRCPQTPLTTLQFTKAELSANYLVYFSGRRFVASVSS